MGPQHIVPDKRSLWPIVPHHCGHPQAQYLPWDEHHPGFPHLVLLSKYQGSHRESLWADTEETSFRIMYPNLPPAHRLYHHRLLQAASPGLSGQPPHWPSSLPYFSLFITQKPEGSFKLFFKEFLKEFLKFTQDEIKHLKVHKAVAFHGFTTLCCYHLYPVLKHFVIPQGNPHPVTACSPFPPLLVATNLLSFSVDLPMLDISFKWNHKYVTFT